jgi:hypothetical protein
MVSVSVAIELFLQGSVEVLQSAAATMNRVGTPWERAMGSRFCEPWPGAEGDGLPLRQLLQLPREEIPAMTRENCTQAAVRGVASVDMLSSFDKDSSFRKSRSRTEGFALVRPMLRQLNQSHMRRALMTATGEADAGGQVTGNERGDDAEQDSGVWAAASEVCIAMATQMVSILMGRCLQRTGERTWVEAEM